MVGRHYADAALLQRILVMILIVMFLDMMTICTVCAREYVVRHSTCCGRCGRKNVRPVRKNVTPRLLIALAPPLTYRSASIAFKGRV